MISYGIGSSAQGVPTIPTPTPTTEITVPRSSLNDEPEGLAITQATTGSPGLPGVLHWQMLPAIKLYSRILNYTPG